MTRYFPRTPGGLASPLSKEETQTGLDLEQQMRRLVAEQMAVAVTRGASPRGAYQNALKDATTKTELWQTGGIIPSAPNAGSMVEQAVMVGGLHSNPCPRGAAHVRSSSRSGNRRRSVSLSELSRPSTHTTKDGQKSKKLTEKKVLGNVLGIYPAENKLPPGRSAADDFAANIVKVFQFGRKGSVVQEGMESSASNVSISGSDGVTAELPAVVREKRRQVRTEPLRSTSRAHDRESRKDNLEGSRRRGSKPRSKSRKRENSNTGLRPAPSYERVYANMPLPTVPPTLPPPLARSSSMALPVPSTVPPPIMKLSPTVLPVPGEDYPPTEKSPPKSLSMADNDLKDRIRRKRSGRTFSPQYEIDIVDWAESVYVFPETPSLQTLSPDPAVEDFPKPPSPHILSPKLPKLPNPPATDVVKSTSLQRQQTPSLRSLSKSTIPRSHSRASSQYSKASSQCSKGSSQLAKKQSLRQSPAYESTTSLDTFDYETIIGTISDVEFESYITTTPSVAISDDISFARNDMKLDLNNGGTGLYGFDDDLEDEIYDHYVSRDSMPIQPVSKLECEIDEILSESTETKVASGNTSAIDLDAEIAAYLAERRKIGREAEQGVQKSEVRNYKPDYKRDYKRAVKPHPAAYRPSEKLGERDYKGKFKLPAATYRPSDKLEVSPPAYATSF